MSCFRDKNNSPSTDQNIIRKLSHVERLQSALHLLRHYLACAISCRYSIPDALLTTDLAGQSLSLEEKVDQAFAKAILDHPLLQVGRINENSKKPSWVRLDRIDLHNHVEWRTVPEGGKKYDDVILEVLEWQINNPFTHLETRPNWRAVILRPADINCNFVDIVFAWDHTTGDGKSGKIFHESLYKHLNGENTEPLKGRSFEVPVTDLMPPPLDKLLKFPISCGFLLTEGLRTLKPPAKADEYMVHWASVQLEPCTSRLSSVAVEEDALQAVLGACRQHQTTLTCLLHALVLASLANRLPADQARAFQNGTPICLRRFIHSGPEGHPGPNLDMEHTVTNSVTYWYYKFDENLVAKVRKHFSNIKAGTESDMDLEATLWSAATALRQELSKKLDPAVVLKNDSLGLTKFVTDWRTFVKDQMKAARTNSWEVSNLGVINGQVQEKEDKPHDGKSWILERAIFAQSAIVAGPTITMNPVAAKGKGFTMTCAWQTEIMDDELVQGLSSDVEAWMNGLGRNGRIAFHMEE